MQQGLIATPAASTFTAISLEASCSGTGTATNNACSSAMTVSAGDLIIVHCYTNNGSFDPSNIVASDGVNGYYRALVGRAHPANSDDWSATFYLENSASGPITPQCSNWEANGMGIIARAYKNTRTSQALDGGSAINLINVSSSTSTTPNAGTAGAPTNSNEVVDCSLVITSTTTVTGGSGYSPGGTLTGAVSTLGAYTQYQVNPSTANCNFSLAAAKSYTDYQVAGLNASNPAGYVGVTGFYGAPAGTQTNGASATVAILNNNSTGTLNTLNGASANTWWSLLAGSAVTFDTSVHPLGSLKLLANGIGHTIGDAGASIKVPSANTTTAYQYNQEGLVSNGNDEWMFSFFRVNGATGNGNFCDNWNMNDTLTGGNETLQVYFDTSPGIHFQIERSQGNTPTVTGLNPSPALNQNQDYAVLWKVPGVNSLIEDVYILYEATPGTLPWIVHDHFTAARTGNHVITTTASASSGASSITVASATGIVTGQAVFSATTSVDTGQIPLGAYVGSSYTPGSTTVPLVNAAGSSITTTASMSTTPVEFAGNTAYQTCSVTAGSTTLTCGSGTGIVGGASNTGQFVGMAGVAAGTWVASGSGTTWTLSQKAVTTQTSVPAQFWNPDGSTLGFHFGKYSSCTFPADFWFSGIIFDPYGTLLPQIANGNLPL